MLAFNLKGDVLEVKETIISGQRDNVTYWYYDIKNWKKSSHGKKNDIPDRDMTPSDIDWVRKYYFKTKGESTW